jgi:hypothetical protein
MMASKDFPPFLNHSPRLPHVSSQRDGRGAFYNPRYDFDEASLPLGAKLHASIVGRRLLNG